MSVLNCLRQQEVDEHLHGEGLEQPGHLWVQPASSMQQQAKHEVESTVSFNHNSLMVPI